ncbi:cell wall assembly regulator Smi1p [Monosporozyma servazzii]
MQSFKKKFKEWVYSLSTEDHYAEYDPNNSPNFNMGVRSGQQPMQGNINPSSVHLTGDEEMNIGGEQGDDINFDDLDLNTGGQEGVSEILLAWRHIDSWTEEHNPDLNATLGDPVTNNDITHAEEDLEISFPASVKVSLRIHDGQEDMESMTGTSGLIYGLQLMTLDQIVAMTQAWRNVASNLKKRQNQSSQPSSSRASMEGNSASSMELNPNIPGVTAGVQRNQFKLPFIPQQKSIPPEAIQAVYAHAAWVPMVTDNAGNHIGVDLAPGANGVYGQVIIFGRDFDTKYVVAQSWGEFLLSFANDLEEGNWWLIEDSDDYLAGDGELVFRDKKRGGPIQEYLEVLKKRVVFKYKQSINEGSVPVDSQQQTTSTQRQSPLQQPIQNVAPVPIELEEPNTTVFKKDINPSKESLRLEDENDVEAIITDEELESEEQQPEEATIKEHETEGEAKVEAEVEPVEEPLEQEEEKVETEEEPVEEPKSVETPVDEEPVEEPNSVETPVDEEPEAEEESVEEEPVEEEPNSVEAPVEEEPEAVEEDETQETEEKEDSDKVSAAPNDDDDADDKNKDDEKVEEVAQQFESVAL